MNKRVILFHLREAAHELQRTIKDVESDAEFDVEDLEVGMGHLYHHLNTAWNGRDQTDQQFRKCSTEDFERFRRFPKAEEFVYLDES